MPTEGQGLCYVRQDNRGHRAIRSWGRWSQDRLCKREKSPVPASVSCMGSCRCPGLSGTGLQDRIHPTLPFYLQLPTGNMHELGLPTL